MMIFSILSYLFIMVVLYLCASASSRRYAISMRRGVVSPHFLTPEILILLFFTFMFAIWYNIGVDYLNYLDIYESGNKLEYRKMLLYTIKSH